MKLYGGMLDGAMAQVPIDALSITFSVHPDTGQGPGETYRFDTEATRRLDHPTFTASSIHPDYRDL